VEMIPYMTPYTAFIWAIIEMILSIVVIAPLSIVWWARLYMDRTGKSVAKVEG